MPESHDLDGALAAFRVGRCARSTAVTRAPKIGCAGCNIDDRAHPRRSCRPMETFRMRILLSCSAVASLFVFVTDCKRQDDTAPAATAPSATAPYTAYPPPQGTYAQPYAQPAPTAPYAPYPQPTAQAPYAPSAPPPPAAAPTPPAPGQMAVPGPVAFQCQNDVPCGTHHCNTQYGKCAFPCQSAADCISPNSCVMGLCVPAPPQAH